MASACRLFSRPPSLMPLQKLVFANQLALYTSSFYIIATFFGQAPGINAEKGKKEER